ncbi:MAG: hypothetical protein ACOCYZ_02855 [Halococcoides sp.]
MTFSITDAVTDGVGAVVKPPVAAAIAVFALFNLLTAVLQETITRGAVEFGLNLAGVTYEEALQALAEEVAPEVPALPIIIDRFDPTIGDMFPLAIGALPPIGAVIGGLLVWVVLAVLAELVYLLAVRATAGDRFAAGRLSRLHFVLVHGLLAGLITMLLVLAGIAGGVLPGLVFAIIFTFVPQVVALEEVNAFRAIADSVGHVWNNALRIVVLGFGFFTAQFLALQAIVTAVGFVDSAWLTTIVMALLQAVFVVLWITIVTEAYLQIRTGTPPATA